MVDFVPDDLVPVLALAAVVLALVAVLVAIAAFVRAGRGRRVPVAESGDQPSTVRSSDKRRSRLDFAGAIRHLAVVRYDAFGDMGGGLSWSMALLDDGGDGVVITAIHGRSDSRMYAKDVTHWKAGQQLSPEEKEVIDTAHRREHSAS